MSRDTDSAEETHRGGYTPPAGKDSPAEAEQEARRKAEQRVRDLAEAAQTSPENPQPGE